jgi:oxygen-independent coproporphyrinogen-3 oxidase
VERGLVELPDDDLAGEMYDETMSLMDDAGFTQYEISNWSRGPGAACRHNLQYWRYLPYLGFGAGAHGFRGNVRVENASLIPQYIDSIIERRETEFPAGPACVQTTRLTPWEMIQENLMVSLRLTDEGVSVAELHDRYGVWVNELFHNQIERLMRTGLLEFNDGGNRMRLTRKGRLFGNRVFAEFIANRVPKGYEFLDG